MAFYNASDHPAGQLGDVWCDGGGAMKVFGPNGWVTICMYSNENAGMLPLSGGEVAGSIDGNHGLLPIDSPKMTGSALVERNALITVSLMREAIKDSIAAALAAKSVSTGGTDGSGSGGATSTSSTPTTIGAGFGRRSPNGSNSGPIPIGPGSDGTWPYFTESNGSRTQALVGECAWIMSPYQFTIPVGLNMASGGGGNQLYHARVTSGGTVTGYSYTERDIGSHESFASPVNFFVIGQRVL